MSNAVILLTGAYHLGNNPGVFQDARFVGHKLEFPATVTWDGHVRDEKGNDIEPPKDVVVTIYTHDVESWGGQGGHALKINGIEVGVIADANNASHPVEIFTIKVRRQKFDAVLGGKAKFTLGIEITGAGELADDFVLTRIETDNFAARLGW